MVFMAQRQAGPRRSAGQASGQPLGPRQHGQRLGMYRPTLVCKRAEMCSVPEPTAPCPQCPVPERHPAPLAVASLRTGHAALTSGSEIGHSMHLRRTRGTLTRFRHSCCQALQLVLLQHGQQVLPGALCKGQAQVRAPAGFQGLVIPRVTAPCRQLVRHAVPRRPGGAAACLTW